MVFRIPNCIIWCLYSLSWACITTGKFWIYLPFKLAVSILEQLFKILKVFFNPLIWILGKMGCFCVKRKKNDERNDVTGTDRSPLSGRNTSSTPTQSKPKDVSVSVTDERKGQNKPKAPSSRGKSDKEKILFDKKHSTHSQQPSSSFYVDVDSGDNRGAEKKRIVRNTSKQHQQQITGKCMPGPEVESQRIRRSTKQDTPFNFLQRKKPKGSASESISLYDTGNQKSKTLKSINSRNIVTTNKNVSNIPDQLPKPKISPMGYDYNQAISHQIQHEETNKKESKPQTYRHEKSPLNETSTVTSQKVTQTKPEVCHEITDSRQSKHRYVDFEPMRNSADNHRDFKDIKGYSKQVVNRSDLHQQNQSVELGIHKIAHENNNYPSLHVTDSGQSISSTKGNAENMSRTTTTVLPAAVYSQDSSEIYRDTVGSYVERHLNKNVFPLRDASAQPQRVSSKQYMSHYQKGMITQDQSRCKENSSQLGSKNDRNSRNIVATPSQTTPGSYSDAVKGTRCDTPDPTKTNEESSGEIIETDFDADEPVTKQQKHEATLQSLLKNYSIEIPKDLGDLINSMTVDTPTENVQPKDIHKFPPVSADDSQLPATYPPHPIMRSSSYDNSSVHHSRESCIQNSFRPSFAEDSNSATKKGAKESIQIQENTRYHTGPVEYPHSSTQEIVSDLMETEPLATKEFSKDQPTNIVKSDFYKNLLKLNSTNGPIDTASIIKADGSDDHLRNPPITNIMPNEPQSDCLEHPNKPQEVFNKNYSPLINETSLLPTPMISHQNSDQLLDFADEGKKSAPFLLRNDLIDDYRTSSKSSNKERSTNEKPFVSTLQNYQNPETSGVPLQNSVSFVSSRKDNTPSIEDCKGHREIAEIEEQTEDLKPQLDETSDFTNKEAVSVTPSPLASAAPVKLDQKPPDKLEAQELLIEATNSGMENKYLVRTQKSIQQITKDNDGDDVTGDLIKCETHTAVGFQIETENDNVERLAMGESDHLFHQKILYESNVLVNNETSIPELQEIIQNRGDSEEHNSHQTSSAHDEADEEHEGRIFSPTDAINNGSTASINESTVFSTDNARYINEKYVGQVMNETYEPPETSHIDCNRPVTEMSSFVHGNDNVDQIPSSLEHQSNEQNSQFYFGQFTNKQPTFSKTSKENEDKAYSGEDKNVFQKEIEVKAQQEVLDRDFVVVPLIPKSAIDANNSAVEDTFSIKSEPSSQQIEKNNEAVKSAEGFLKNESHVESGFQEERESSGIEISTNIVSSTQEKRVDDANQRKQKVVESVSHPLESGIQDILSGKSEGPRTQIPNKVAEFLGQSKDDSFVLKKESKIVEINTSVLKNENALTLTSDGDSNLSPHPGATEFPFYSESMTKKNAEEINLDKINAIGDNVEVITKDQPATEMQDTKIIDRYKDSPKNESFPMEKNPPTEFRADTDNKSDPSDKANHVNQAMQLSEKPLHNEDPFINDIDESKSPNNRDQTTLPLGGIEQEEEYKATDRSDSSLNHEQDNFPEGEIGQKEESEGWTAEQKQVIDTLKQIYEKAIPFEADIEKFTKLEDSNEHYYIEESLRRLVDKLDDLYDDIGEHDILRGKRKEVYKFIFPLFDRLDDKVEENRRKKQKG